MVIEAANAVGQTVTDQVSLTEKFLNNFRNFAETRGIDISEAIIVFIIGYIICREIKKGAFKCFAFTGTANIF